MGFLVAIFLFLIAGSAGMFFTIRYISRALEDLGIHLPFFYLFRQLHGYALIVPILGSLWVLKNSWEMIEEIR